MPPSLGPRASRVYEALRDAIAPGRLAPGVKLPATARLAADFEVAPVTARSALRRIEAEGLLAREVGGGTFVSALARPAVLVVDDEPGGGGPLGGHVARTGFEAVSAGGSARHRSER